MFWRKDGINCDEYVRGTLEFTVRKKLLHILTASYLPWAKRLVRSGGIVPKSKGGKQDDR